MTDELNQDKPAFPSVAEGGDSSELYPEIHYGLMRRELFAAMAMQGLLSSGLWPSNNVTDNARTAVAHADALIAALDASDGGE